MQTHKTYIPLRDRDVVRFSEFLKQSDIGRTKGYELVNSGELQTITIGKLRYVIVQSWLDFIERQRREQPTFKRNWHPPGRRSRNSAPNDEAISAPTVAADPPLTEAPAASAPRRGRGRPRGRRNDHDISARDLPHQPAPGILLAKGARNPDRSFR